MTQNKKITIIIIIIGIATLFSILLIRDTSAQSASVWFPDGQGDSYLVPVDSLWGLKVPGLATSTTGCLGVNSTGWISASGSACGTGVGGGGDNPGFDFITIGGTSHSASSTRPFYFGQCLLAASSTLGYLNVGYINATSTTATSTFAGGLTVNGTGFVVNQGVPANSFIVNTNGNVGIGTAVPAYRLDVVNSVDDYVAKIYNSTTNTNTHGGLLIDMAQGAVGAGTAYALDVKVENVSQFVVGQNVVAFGSGVSLTLGSDKYIGYDVNHYYKPWDGNNAVLHLSSDSLRTRYDASNYLETTIGSTGLVTLNAVGSGSAFSFSDNVGIGETAPVSKLSVSGGGTFGASYDTTVAPTNGLLVEGNVGIGTTTPYSLLSISNSASTAANTPLFTIASTTAGTATSTLMTVLANGNVGIGTAAPMSKLQLTDTANLYLALNSTANTPEVAISMNTNTDSSNLWWVGINDDSSKNYSVGYGMSLTLSGTKLAISTGGNVGIGTTTPAQLLSVQGNGLISGNLTLANLIATGTVNIQGQLSASSTATSTFAGGIETATGIKINNLLGRSE